MYHKFIPLSEREKPDSGSGDGRRLAEGDQVCLKVLLFVYGTSETIQGGILFQSGSHLQRRGSRNIWRFETEVEL